MNADEAVDYIRSILTRLPRPSEIEDAVHKAGAAPGGSSWMGITKSRPAKLAFDASVLARVAAKRPEVNMEWLIARSPVPPHSVDACSFLRGIFRPGEHVLILSKYKSQGQVVWTHDNASHPELDAFRKDQAEGVWFLSNPCSGVFQSVERLKKPTNPAGMTRRAEENITAFRHALIESDDAPPDLWLSALCQMPLPILSIVTSGGRSLHALIRVNAASKAQWDDIVRGELLQPLTLLGADDQALTAVRLTRLPGCLRYGKTDNNGSFCTFPGGPRLQMLLFLNPSANGTPIMDLSGNLDGHSAS